LSATPTTTYPPSALARHIAASATAFMVSGRDRP
jgi:hypothetical protein